jgi:blocked-early-in-transport protein 1
MKSGLERSTAGTTGTTTATAQDHMYQRRGAGRNAPSSSNGHFNSNIESGMNANETNRNIIEQQNNERVSELSDQVARLKGLTIDIGNEVREQNALLDNMGDGFSNTRDLLQGSLRRVGTMLQRGGRKHMCYLVGFVFFVMFFLYWVMSTKGTSGY